jgi:hypothetical protein
MMGTPSRDERTRRLIRLPLVRIEAASRISRSGSRSSEASSAEATLWWTVTEYPFFSRADENDGTFVRLLSMSRIFAVATGSILTEGVLGTPSQY